MKKLVKIIIVISLICCCFLVCSCGDISGSSSTSGDSSVVSGIENSPDVSLEDDENTSIENGDEKDGLEDGEIGGWTEDMPLN